MIVIVVGKQSMRETWKLVSIDCAHLVAVVTIVYK